MRPFRPGEGESPLVHSGPRWADSCLAYCRCSRKPCGIERNGAEFHFPHLHFIYLRGPPAPSHRAALPTFPVRPPQLQLPSLRSLYLVLRTFSPPLFGQIPGTAEKISVMPIPPPQPCQPPESRSSIPGFWVQSLACAGSYLLIRTKDLSPSHRKHADGQL